MTRRPAIERAMLRVCSALAPALGTFCWLGTTGRAGPWHGAPSSLLLRQDPSESESLPPESESLPR